MVDENCVSARPKQKILSTVIAVDIPKPKAIIFFFLILKLSRIMNCKEKFFCSN